MARKAAAGTGNIRKKTVKRNGKEYVYWEARYTAGYDPGTGKQIQRSITGKTQKEVAQKLKEATHEIDEGTYIAPNRTTVGQWMDTWFKEYTGGVKPATKAAYEGNIRLYIKPALGAVKLAALQPHMVQGYVNGLSHLAPATVRVAYAVLNMALEQAVRCGYIPKNPAKYCELPRKERKEVKPLTDEEAAALLEASRGTLIEHLLRVALFTGMRLSELLGLTWDAVNYQAGTILVDKQLTRHERRKDETDLFASPKSGKSRTIHVAPSVVQFLRKQQTCQTEMRLMAGPAWEDTHNLVFTTESGHVMENWKAESEFRKVVAKAGLKDIHFHQIRHTYAVNSLRAGDDIKSVQGNMGHATAAFTLDVYGSFTERMKEDSASRMERFIKGFMSQ